MRALGILATIVAAAVLAPSAFATTVWSQVNQNDTVSVGTSDSLLGGVTLAGTYSGAAAFVNNGAGDLASTTIHVATASPPDPPDVTGPLAAGATAWNYLASRAADTTVPFAADRTISNGSPGPGPTHEVATIHVTTGDASLGAFGDDIYIFVDGAAGPLTASNYAIDSASPGVRQVDGPTTNGIGMYFDYATPHTTYTVRVSYDLSNPASAAYAYKPRILTAEDVRWNAGAASSVAAESTTDARGTTYTFSAGEPSDWMQQTLIRTTTVQFDSVASGPPPPAPLPSVTAKVNRGYSVFPGPSDSVSSAPQQLNRFFSNELYSGGTVRGAQITLGPRTTTYDPPLATPATVGPQDASELSLNVGNVAPVTGSIGFDASRSLSVSGSDVTSTVSITPSDARGDSVAFDLDCSNSGSADAAISGGVVWPTLTHGESVNYENVSADGKFAFASIFGVVPGATYTFQVTCHLNAAGAYKPWSTVQLGKATTYPEVDGTSTVISDPAEGGDYTFSSADPVAWQGFLTDNWAAYFQSESPYPDYTAALDQATYEVHAGNSFAPQLTLTPGPGFTGSFSFWLTNAGADPPTFPSNGFYQSGPWPTATISGTSPVTVSLPIGTQSSLAPGTYHFEIGANVTGGTIPDKRVAFTLVVDPALPSATVSDVHYQQVVRPPGVDSLAAGDVNAGWDNWWADFYSLGSAPVHDATLSIDGSSRPWTPAVSFPLIVSAAQLDPSASDLSLTTLAPWGSSRAPSPGISVGYDLTRTKSTQTIGPGGGDQIDTVTITPRAAALAGKVLDVSIETDGYIGGPTVDPASITWPDTSNGENLSTQVYSDSVFFSLYGVQLNKPYTLTYTVHVPNATPGTITYDPDVFAQGFVGTSGPSPTGTSFSYFDSALGGTIAATSSDIVNWSSQVNTGWNATLSGRADNSIAVDHFRVQLTSSPVTAGAPAGVRVTALDAAGHVVTRYPGPVKLTDADGNTLASSLTFVNGVGTGTTTFATPYVNQVLHATDVSGLNAAAAGASGVFQVYGPLDHFRVVASPSSGPTTTPITLTVTAKDVLNHTLTAYAGGLTLTDAQSAAGLSLPSALTWLHGVGTGTATASAGIRNDAITAADGSAQGTSGTFSRAGAPSRFAISVSPSSVPVSGSVTVKVTPYDAVGNLVATYTGSPAVTDSAGVLTLGAWSGTGVRSATATFSGPAKADRATAADGSVVSPASNAFNVIGPAARLAVSAQPSSVPVAGSLTVKVTAYDAAGNVATGYGATPSLSDAAGVAVFAAGAPVSGVSTSTATFAGPAKADRVTASDGTLASPASNAFNVVGPAVSFRVVEAPTTLARTALATVTTTALDAAGNVATGYAGTVRYTDNLALAAVAPGPYDQVNTNGVIVAHIPFTRGPVASIRIVVTDSVNALLNGTSNAFRIT